MYGRYCTAFCFAYTSQTSSNENWDHCPATFNWALKQVQEKLPRGTEVPESYRWLQHHAPLATCHKHSQTVQVIMGGTSLLTPKRLIRALRPEIIRRMDHESLWNGDHLDGLTKTCSGQKPMLQEAPGKLAKGCQRMHLLKGLIPSKELRRSWLYLTPFDLRCRFHFFLDVL